MSDRGGLAVVCQPTFSNMFPSVSINNLLNGGDRNAKAFGQLVVATDPRAILRSDRKNVGSFKLAGSMGFPADSPSSPLGNRVPDIIAFGSKKQVVWSYARGIVAAMQNTNAIGNASVRKEPRNPMGIRRDASSLHNKCSISSGCLSEGPFPTSAFGTFDGGPETGLEMALTSRHVG